MMENHVDLKEDYSKFLKKAWKEHGNVYCYPWRENIKESLNYFSDTFMFDELHYKYDLTTYSYDFKLNNGFYSECILNMYGSRLSKFIYNNFYKKLLFNKEYNKLFENNTGKGYHLKSYTSKISTYIKGDGIYDFYLDNVLLEPILDFIDDHRTMNGNIVDLYKRCLNNGLKSMVQLENLFHESYLNEDPILY